MAYMMWFHASGSPATHQCVQSHPCRPRPAYTDGCASIRSCDIAVMSNSDTGEVMAPITPRTTACSGSMAVSPASGSGRVWLRQLPPRAGTSLSCCFDLAGLNVRVASELQDRNGALSRSIEE
jgi:hypothetical protein